MANKRKTPKAKPKQRYCSVSLPEELVIDLDEWRRVQQVVPSRGSTVTAAVRMWLNWQYEENNV